MAFVQKLFSTRQNYDDGSTRIGDEGRLWYDSETNTLRVGDGSTPGGIIVSAAGGGGGGPGTSGYSGRSGYSGYSGRSGWSGFSGSAGANGASGISGWSGFSGSAGTAGVSGYSGFSGFSGINGIVTFSRKVANYTASVGQGIIADTSAGPWTLTLPLTPNIGDIVTVVDGANWVTNNLTINPNGQSIEGTFADLVLDISNIRIDFIYDGTTWEVFASVGTIGESGTSGTSGYSGVSGFSGPAGGPTGPSGDSGYSGYSGDSGFSGFSGNSGYSGDSGYSGFSGDSGYSGISGFSGIQANLTSVTSDIIPTDDGVYSLGSSGYRWKDLYVSNNSIYIGEGVISVQGSQVLFNGDSLSGFSGTSGLSGYSGYSGTSGWSGYSGTSGYTGISGYSGESGYSGYSGYSSHSGWSGISGFSGWSGLSGYSGYSGDSGISGWSGASGLSGQNGNFGGASFDYTFGTDITNTDPGSGYLKFNNNNISLATALYIDDEQDGPFDIQLYLRTIDDSTSTIKGHFKVSRKFDTTSFVLFTVSGLTEQSGYFEVSCSYVSGSVTSFANNDDIIITFARTGDKGDQGISGYSGISGWSGVSGFSGYTGISGWSGYTGYSGDSGISGWSGISGFSGWSGISGFSGWSGISGWSGWSGVSGFSGYTGISGFSGYTGVSGWSGWSGISGFSGYTGVSGFSGWSGVSGFSGYTGTSGYSGQAGPSNTINATTDSSTTALYPVFVGAAGSNQTAKTTSSIVFNASNGNIGIGSTAPGRRLTVGATTTGSYEMQVGGGSVGQSATLDVVANHDSIGFQVWDDNNLSVPKFIVQRAGNVGIGVTNPSVKLHVNGTAWITRPANKIDNSGATEFGSRVEFNNSFNVGQSGYAVFRWPTSNNFRINTDFDGNVGVGGTLPNIQFGMLDNVYIHINNDGKVGIGTTAPNTRMSVETSGANGLSLRPDTGATTNSARLFLESTSGSYALLNSAGSLLFASGSTVGSDTGTERMRITSDGYVGIGTTAPSDKVHISNSGGLAQLRIGDTASTAVGLLLQRRNGGLDAQTHWSVFSDNSPWYLFGQNLTWTGERAGTVTSTHIYKPYYEAFAPVVGYKEFGFVNKTSGSFVGTDLIPSLVLKNDGNVGIGTTAPGTKLDVQSNTGAVIRVKATGDGTQATLSLDGYAGGGFYRASRINFLQNNVTKWSLIQDYNQNNTNDLTFEQAGSVKALFDSSANFSLNGGTFIVDNTKAYQLRDSGGTARYALYMSNAVSPGAGDLVHLGNPLNNPLVFFTNNSEKVRITAAGRFGIGTTAPDSPFQVQLSSSDVNSSVQTSYTTGVNSTQHTSKLGIYAQSINNTSSSGAAAVQFEVRNPALNGNHGTTAYMVLTPGSGTTYGNGRFDFYIRNDTAPYAFYNDSSASSDYWMSSLMTIQSNGNVGIGTTAPAYRADISATTTYDSTSDAATVLRVGSLSGRYPTFPGEATAIAITKAGEKYGWRLLNQYTSDQYTGMDFHLQVSADVTPTWSTKLFVKGTTGNVGIGTTNPNSWFEVNRAGAENGSVQEISRFVNTAAGATSGYLYIGSSSGIDWRIGKNVPGLSSRVNFDIGDTTGGVRFTINSSGDVGIGTTAPGSRLSVTGPNTGSVPLLDLTATGTGTFQRGVRLLNGGMNAGDQIMYGVGYADNSRNMGQFYFYYAGSGSTSNRISMGLHSVDDVFNILGTGNVGIGTTAPDSLTQINRNSDTSNTLNLFDTVLNVGNAGANPGNHYSSGIRIYQGSGTVGSGLGVALIGADNGTATAANQYVAQFVAPSGMSGGIRLTALDTNGYIRFSTGGDNERIRITAAGSVGIGTTSPSGKFHITSSAITAAAPSLGWPVYNAEADTNSRPIYIDTGGNGSVQTAGQGATVAILLGQYFDSRVLITPTGNGSGSPGDQGTGYGKDLMLKAGTSDNGVGYKGGRLYLSGGMGYTAGGFNGNVGDILMQPFTSAGGNVGIGTTAAEGKLDIVGSPINGTQQADWSGAGISYNSYGDLTISRRHGATKDNAYGYTGPIIDFRASNTVNEWSVAQIMGTIDPQGGTNHQGGLVFLTSSGGTTDPTGRRTQGAAPQVRMMIGHSGDIYMNGKLGIGTSSPSAYSKLHVYGATGAIGSPGLIYSENTDDAYALYIKNGGNSSQNDRAIFEAIVGSTSVLRVNNSGNVGIGTTAPGYKLTVNGTDPSVLGIDGGSVTHYTKLNRSIPVASTTVDAFRFVNSAGTVVGNSIIIGTFTVYAQQSGGNSFGGVYSVVSHGNGTINATLTVINATTTRGTSPVTSVQLADDGVSGAIKLTITYNAFAGGGSPYATVTFVGQVY